MRSLMFLLVLVLFCSVPMTSSGMCRCAIDVANCCMKFSNVKIPVRQVKSYYWTSSSCPKSAIVFQTFAGKEFCVDPEITWVNSHVDKVDKRTAAATTTTTTPVTTTTSSAATTATTAKTQSPTV